MDGPDESDPNVQRHIRKKQYQLEKAKVKSSKSAEGRSDDLRDNTLPPGQTRAPSWLVLDIRPSNFEYSFHDWSLEVVHHKLGSRRIGIEDLIKRGDLQWRAMDFHCVTSWSYCGLSVRGAPLTAVLESLFAQKLEWDTMLQCGADKYTTTMPRQAVLAANPILAFEYRDLSSEVPIPLGVDHGGVRILFDNTYGYKSCKWLIRLELLCDPSNKVKGFWEKKGYSDRAKVSIEERFAEVEGKLNLSRIIMNPLNGWFSWYAINFPENFLTAQQCLSFDIYQTLLNWRFYWMILSFWVCFPLYVLYNSLLYLLRGGGGDSGRHEKTQ
jgi:DMSO/TMAO reductase YedYZ molybdopterin-dependent catalytic subunit